MPDRSDCQDSWLPDIEDEINNPDIPSTDNSEVIENELGKTDEGVTGDTLNTLPDVLGDLLEKRAREINDSNITPEDQMKFYLSFMSNIDTLISFKKTWRDLDPTKFNGPNITTNYIKNVNKLGEIFLRKSLDNSCKSEQGNRNKQKYEYTRVCEATYHTA